MRAMPGVLVAALKLELALFLYRYRLAFSASRLGSRELGPPTGQPAGFLQAAAVPGEEREAVEAASKTNPLPYQNRGI